MTRTMGLLIVLVALGCGDSTGPPDTPEFFLTTDSTSYTLKETSLPGLFFINIVTQFTNALPDTVYFGSCLGTPLPLSTANDGGFSPSGRGPTCSVAGLRETPLAPGAVTTDTLRWLLSNIGNDQEDFNRLFPGTFRALLIVSDSLGEAFNTGREIAKELRVSAPFDVLLAPGTGG